MSEHLTTADGRIIVDCFHCKGCGESDASGFACPACGGKGYTVHKKPARDYEAAGARAYRDGTKLRANPYRWGWPLHGWTLGWINERDRQRAAATGCEGGAAP